MTGRVLSREAWITITVRGPNGASENIDAVVDTGFTGWLTLPGELIKALELTWKHEGKGLLADGSPTTFNVYLGEVVWNRRIREVYVDQSDATPLIGMTLLKDCELNMQVRQGGKVSIKPLPLNRKRTR